MTFARLVALAAVVGVTVAQCPIYADFVNTRHEPFSTGRFNLPYQRPIPQCRTFRSPEVEDAIARLEATIADPDLFRIFENAFPNTLDTTVKWRGFAEGTDEELTFVVTGDIDAMWLRDSASQLHAYVPLIKANASLDSLASVFRGAINLQARNILEAPYCNAFQAPSESGIPTRSSQNSDRITPSFDYHKVFSCNWELDSLASFLQLSVDYVNATGDYDFFSKYQWPKAIDAILSTTESMTMSSYDDAGNWLHTNYTYCAPYGGTPINNCNGSPHKGHIGLIRSFHRPSDDACIYQYLIPSNMMFSRYLDDAAAIADRLAGHDSLANQMRSVAAAVRTGIDTYGIVDTPTHGRVYAFEVDGYGSTNLMDDSNVPSLLSAPFLGYVPRDDAVYQNTRARALSPDNPYYSWGPVLSTVGSPHTMPGRGWPMAAAMTILTSDDDKEIAESLRQLVQSTAGTGMIHESIDSHRDSTWSRPWWVFLVLLSAEAYRVLIIPTGLHGRTASSARPFWT